MPVVLQRIVSVFIDLRCMGRAEFGPRHRIDIFGRSRFLRQMQTHVPVTSDGQSGDDGRTRSFHC